MDNPAYLRMGKVQSCCQPNPSHCPGTINSYVDFCIYFRMDIYMHVCMYNDIYIMCRYSGYIYMHVCMYNDICIMCGYSGYICMCVCIMIYTLCVGIVGIYMHVCMYNGYTCMCVYIMIYALCVGIMGIHACVYV